MSRSDRHPKLDDAADGITTAISELRVDKIVAPGCGGKVSR